MPKPDNRRISRWAIFFIALLLLLGSTSCTNLTDFENAQVIDSEPLGYLSPDQRLGQSFLLRRAPLTGIKLHLRLADEAQDLDSNLLFRLYSDPYQQESFYAGQVTYQQIRSNFPLTISFPALPVEAGSGLYLELEASGSPIWVYGRTEDMYPDGQMYLAGQPQMGDLAFSLFYEYGWGAFGEDLLRLLRNAWLIIPLAALLLLPGVVSLQLSRLNHKYHLPEKIGLAIGISLALTALFITWASRFGLRFSVWLITAVYVTLAFSVLFLRWRALRLRKTENAGLADVQTQRTGFQKTALAGLILLAVFLAVLFLRFAMVRDLSGPAWVDSVHHTLVSRMIHNQGRIPADFSPYSQADATNYHTGMHVSVAVLSWLSGLELVDSLFILGQVLNAVVLFGIYLLAFELTGSRLAGLIAALLTGFASPMPAYYTSWGRYTQLAGLVILPAAFVLLRQVYRKPTPPQTHISDSWRSMNWPVILLAAGTCSGLFFVHYRVAAFLACLVAADLLVMWIVTMRDRDPKWKINSRGLLSSAIATLLLSLPVLIPVVIDLLPRRAVQWNQAGSVEPFAIPWAFLTAGLGLQLLFAAGIGLLVALVVRSRLALLLLLWVAFMFLAANLNRLGLPTGGFISNDSVVISLFIPLTVLGGYLAAASWDFARQAGLAFRAAIGLVIIVLSAYTIVAGSPKLLSIINPVTVFLRSGDRAAAEWVAENLPADAAVLINPAPWGYRIFVGSDGGYWLSPLTGRLTFPPTLLYGHGNREDIAQINTYSAEVLAHANDPAYLARFMAENALDYLYLGVRGGPISSRAVLQSKDFELLYHQQGAWIFRRLDSPAN